MKNAVLLGALLLIGVQMWTEEGRAALPVPPPNRSPSCPADMRVTTGKSGIADARPTA